MAKSEDLRMAAVEHYLGNSAAFSETGKIFGVSATSVKRWVDRYEATGSAANKPLNRVRIRRFLRSGLKDVSCRFFLRAML